MPAEFLFLCADELSQLRNTSLLKEFVENLKIHIFHLCQLKLFIKE